MFYWKKPNKWVKRDEKWKDVVVLVNDKIPPAIRKRMGNARKKDTTQ